MNTAHMSTTQISNFNHFFTHELNPEQQEVVAPKNGILLVCAGAGSGKTRVITARMAYLMKEHGIRPYEIVALTFTNKAAREMKERMVKFLGEDAILPYVGTFHSYCLRILKSNSNLLSIGNFSLMDDNDQEKIIRALITRFGLHKKITPKNVLSFISRIKNEASNQQERMAFYEQDMLMRDLYLAYEHEKTQAHCLDFDDLLIKTLELFDMYPHFKEQFQNTVRHLLVDEYQDTNKVQHALLKKMALGSDRNFAIDSLCVVGDEDQSIYSWRGATVSNIINFNKDFPAARYITIEQNYRSVQPILHAANEIIRHNVIRNPKKLWSSRSASDRIRVLSCSSGYQEGEALAIFLQKLQIKNSLNACAILYRSHFQSRAIEEALIRHSIPYKIIGGVQFYDRLEIKDLLAYLKLVVNPFDRLAFGRAINTPARGLGDKFEQLFYELWNQQPLLEFKAIAQLLIDDHQLTRSKQEALKQFITIFEGLNGNGSASEIITHIINKTRYYSYLKESFEEDEAEIKKENVKEFINGIIYFEQQRENASLDIFLEEVALLQEALHASQDEQEQVKLMTLHAAKGLEFDTVMLTGLEENIIPSAHSVYNPESLEEERRLLYVGITRARERLLISHTRYRFTYGQMTDQRPSRFIEELPNTSINKADCAHWNQTQIQNYFADWLQNKPAIQEKIIQPEPKITSYGNWKQGQVVVHPSFGQGVIEKIEKKSDEKYYLTIRFKSGIKKLDAAFVS